MQRQPEQAGGHTGEVDRLRQQLVDHSGSRRQGLGGRLLGTAEAAAYPDVRSVPGVGPRLARLGCSSLAVLPLPEEGRLLLDASRPPRAGGWIERARPYLELVAAMAGSGWASGGSLRSEQEVAALDRLFAACQETLGRAASTDDLLDSARQSLEASELFLITGLPPL